MYDDDRHSPHVDFAYIRRALRHRHPRFSSVQEFGRFAAIVADEWRSPGISSVSGVLVELARLGCRVQTSLNPADFGPAEVDHLNWIIRLLHEADAVTGRQKLTCWGRVDVVGQAQRDVAERAGIATSTLSDWILEVRDVLAELLERDGALHV